MTGLKKLEFRRALNVIFFTGLLLLNACMPTGSVSNKRGTTKSNATNAANGSSGSGAGAVSDTTSTNSSTVSSQKVELSHLVDPYTGTYKKKITIPKNYKGYLYIAGLNLSALASKIIKVRLNYGVDGQTVTMGATLARAPGITPKTDIQVLVLDLTKAPLQDMRLPYDLYDYNEYNADSTLEPVTNNLDSGLYCRGVKLADDPTFIPSNDSSTCSLATDKCLYAYAKIQDASFYDSLGITTSPVRPAIWGGSTTLSQTLVNGMCLADNSYANFLTNYLTYIPSGMTYQGPYRPINQSSWALSDAAIFGSSTVDSITTYNGLFETLGNANDKTTWYRSLLFPRAGVVAMNTGVNYIGSATKFGPRTTMSSDSTGYSKYIDGCNIRVQNYDASSNEGIGSCTVTGTIEIFYMSGSSEVSITKTNALKIQLTRASITNTEGKEVLSSSFKTCESSASCGAEECCYNNRCWSKDLVSQCVDDIAQTGNREIGTSCTSDYQCASLCCNGSTGACAPHNPTATTPILCSKSAGQSCVSKEFCAMEYVPICKLYKNGTNPDGTIKCTVRCPTVATYGTCVGGSCVAPVGQTDTSSFDLVKCTGAIDP